MLGKNKLFSQKVRTIVEDRGCQHFNESMRSLTSCPYCAHKIQPSTKTEYKNYAESDVEGFITEEIYRFNETEYKLYRDEEKHQKATRYFIVVEVLGYGNMYTQKYKADHYIIYLEEAKKISEAINKIGLCSIPTIVDFQNYNNDN